MKAILILCALVLVGALAWVLALRPWRDHHGSAFRELPSASLARILERPSDHLRKELRLEGTVVRQCPCCGCWFVLRDADGRELRIEAGDTLGRLPFRLGRRATVEGELIRWGEGYELIGNAVEFH